MGRQKRGIETIVTGWEIDLGLEELTEVLLEADCFLAVQKGEDISELEIGEIFIKEEEDFSPVQLVIINQFIDNNIEDIIKRFENIYNGSY